MGAYRKDWLRRFILLIDTLYYMHRNVVIEADVSLQELFTIQTESDSLVDEAFAYQRCLSRLNEIGSKEY